MKSVHKLLVAMAGAGSLVFASCTEFLREEPKAIRSSNSYYGDVTTLKSGLMGIYLSFQNLYRDELPYIGELGTDESIPQFYMPDFNTVFRYQLDANNEMFVGKWYRKHYEMISRANVVISRGSSLAASDAEAAAIVAEAKMLRA